MSKRDRKAEPRVEVRASAAANDLEYRPFPGPRGAVARLRVAMGRSAYADLTAHAKESLEAEVCGVLIGRACEDDEGPWVDVQAIIRGAAARQGSTHVTFTQETWNTVHETLEREHRGARIVGWYHTHPGFGVEFSEMDLFIQRNFFPGPQQIAFVTDPLGGAVAICANGDDGIHYLERFWVDGREQPCRQPEAARPEGGAGSAVAAAEAPAGGAAVRAIEERVAQLIQAHDDLRALFHRMVITVGLCGCMGILGLVGYWIYSSHQSRLEPPRVRNFVPIPVQIGDQSVLLGVNLVEWRVPPQLEADFLKRAAAETDQRIEELQKLYEQQLALIVQRLEEAAKAGVPVPPEPTAPGEAKPTP